ncbi:hypothetical protein DEU56DRAFT_763989 [Suillus clintonianus]|uniref:uncharacterized protein n=1 Tax=Suillus clintonianus TaxID=1904413 RepID=UPI001B869C02|nr:uncharacterized protein DEU56DRAFT_763989 [Suillus clintonianus]KAG2157315.1 hypothetical protein DEU56DRAFT_763989 [Suillus clintonianus]
MSITALSHQVRIILEEAPDDARLEHALQAVDEFIRECAVSKEPDVLLFRLEEELQSFHSDTITHNSLQHTEVLLSILYRLRPLLTSISVISTWFDLVLRPALREPRLSTPAVNHAKELIISAADRTDERYPEKVGEFRRRLLDLYVLDAYNEGSGDDLLEWAELDQEQREKRSLWKFNLEDVLVKSGLRRPQDFMSAINYSFATPSSRLQLLILLNRYTSEPPFQSLAAAFADHPLLDSLLNSLLLDNSSTVCTIGLTVIVKLLPIFAVKACQELKMMLPRLLAILARIICWKERSVPKPAFEEGAEDTDENSANCDAQESAQNESTASSNLPLRPELGWERLELTFNAASSAPPPGIYFSCLYYLFPCNLLRFLRGPSAYINDRGYESPYSISWEDALDEDNIRSKSESLLRGRIVNSRVIWGDWTKELTEPDTWANYSVSRIASECTMLDVRNTALGSKQFSVDIASATAEPPVLGLTTIFDGDTSTAPTPHPGYAELPATKTRVSLESMITASVALKSNLDVEIDAPTAAWSSLLFPTGNNSPTKRLFDMPSEPNTYNEQLPSHVAQAISGLQREVLLLRNELNFELWLSRENVKHIGRLYQDRILSKNAEVEQQGLFNKLRHYRAEVQRLDRQLREHREQSSSAKNKYADWNTELQNKLKEFREEKKAWVSEAASLRTAEKEAQALFAAQGQLLADAAKQVFELQTQRKETQHKVDRLRDYERQIEQHIRMQRLWDADFQKFNDRAEELQQLRTQFKQAELHLGSYQKTCEQMSEDARSHRRQNQALEARLSLLQKKCDASRRLPEAEIAAFMAEKSELAATNARLREENADLKDEMGEMRARMELMKARIDGHKGLIAETRSMPAL